MTTSSIIIVVRRPITQAMFQGERKASSNAREECLSIRRMFNKIAAGLAPANLEVLSGNAAVRSTGTVTLTYASINAADTVTIAGTALSVITSGTPTATQFLKATNATVTAANLAAAINANTTTSQYVYATSAAAVVTLTALTTGLIGNLITQATSNSAGFTVSAATLTGGSGGPNGAIISYSLGL